MTDEQERSMDEWLEANAQSLVAAKVALVFAVHDEHVASPELRQTFQDALDFYQGKRCQLRL